MTYQHIAKKRFGQNFLHDQFIIREILQIISPKADDFILEIGPGLGALTAPLLEYIKPLHVIEIDYDIISYLNQKFKDSLIIHSGDALKFDYNLNGIIKPKQKIRLVGNLPYNISTPLLFHLSEFPNILDMHFMLQKEVVERICAKPDNGHYGRLSVMLQYKFSCYKMLDVPNDAFDPRPKVESAIVRLKPKPKEMWHNINEKKLNHIVTNAFSKRRKTIANSLKNIISIEILDQLGIDKQKRAENLTIAEYLALANLS